jgi:hypothetical protein
MNAFDTAADNYEAGLLNAYLSEGEDLDTDEENYWTALLDYVDAQV